MGDTEQDDNFTCAITTKLNSSAENKKNTVVEYRSPNRPRSLKIGLIVSIGLNAIFAVLFVVVFILLSDMNARLSRFDELLNKEKVRPAEGYGSNKVEAVITPTDSGYRSSTRPQESLIQTPTQVHTRRKYPPIVPTATNVNTCKCRGPPGI
ncbi:Hypothetical predicted protein [Paramuricea clavata]|uniref:Uncharacterized protein n=1 Tax=Paramuricea clavata TaxID=317549 RepID=A0A7D9ERJ8_PARCT|nr:Hypothetical predicted protein [Paramuricea clavata]